ncbi:hypothetical protein D3C86_1757990 [compost metagenome]
MASAMHCGRFSHIIMSSIKSSVSIALVFMLRTGIPSANASATLLRNTVLAFSLSPKLPRATSQCETRKGSSCPLWNDLELSIFTKFSIPSSLTLFLNGMAFSSSFPKRINSKSVVVFESKCAVSRTLSNPCNGM